ncbi:MAG: phosphotriesterase, partial [Pseudoflavonifractor sp.]
MGLIHTVCGDLSPTALGHCQIHEHIFVRPTPMAEKNPALCFEDFDRSLRELRDYKAGGGSFLVDAQPVAAGRDAAVLRQLS